MKHANVILIGSLALWIVGCASAPKGGPMESTGPSATEQTDAREIAPTDVNREEFLWNNEFGEP